MNLFTALWAEAVKVRHAKIFAVSVGAALFLPVVFALVLSGHVETNLSLGRPVNWRLYVEQLELLIAVGGLIGFGFVFSWLFGREYVDKTVSDLLVLPVNRSIIVLAKILLGSLWCALLAQIVFACGYLSARWLAIDGAELMVVAKSWWHYMATTAMTISLSTPAAWSASWSRGYMSPLALVLVAVIAAQFSIVLGLGPYFPWAVPGLYTGAAGEAAARLGSVSLSLPYVVGLLGVVLTLFWWRRADH